MDGAAAVDYILANNIPGDFCEVGVGSGDFPCIFAKRLLEVSKPHRHLWLYDTFEGLTEPSAEDYTVADRQIGDHHSAENVKLIWDSQKVSDGVNNWCRFSLQSVVTRLGNTGWPRRNSHFIKGDVRHSLRSAELPQHLAILRLDTDFYDSTKVELEVLYDRLVPGGLLILDDYFFWQGQRKAVNEFFAAKGILPAFAAVGNGKSATYIKSNCH